MTSSHGTEIMKRLSRVAVGTLTACMCVPALAQQDLGDVANTLTGQITDFGQLIGATAVLVGIGMLIMSAIKFRAYSTNPQDPSASVGGAVGWLLAGAALVGIPEFLDIGVTSLFGSDATTGTLAGGNLLN